MIPALAAEGYFVVRGFLDPNERASLRGACDALLERVRASSVETGHSTPRITLDVREAYELLAAPRVVAILPREVVRLRTVHYYREQTKKDWDGDWHRDAGEVHLRLALEDDPSLEIVPFSHARADTREELAIMKGAHRAASAMPGAARIELRAGDACVFDARLIHRARYRREPVRRTIDAVFDA